MRIAVILTLLALPAAAFDLMETKSGKLIPVEEASRVGDRLHVRLALRQDQYVATTYPIDAIIPEFVFYVWEKGLPGKDRAAYRELAEWARGNGLFSLALRVYDNMAEFDPGIKNELADLALELHAEEASWLFKEAESLFRDGEIDDARVLVDRLLDAFEDAPEHGPAEELRKMIDEREKFLGEERRRKEAARRMRRQRIDVRTQAARIAQGKAYADGANLRYVAVARWRLNWACCLYEGAVDGLERLRPFVQDEALLREIDGHVQDALGRSIAAHIRLADLRYLTGDFGAALDAAHHVLDIDPTNAAAAGIRDRILDGPGPTHITRDKGFLTYRRAFVGTCGFGLWRARR